MNVALIAPRLPPHCDGVGDHADALACALSRCGHTVTALTAGPALERREYRTIVLGPAWGWQSTARAVRFLAAHRPGRVLMEYTPFLYGGASPAPLLIALACRLLGIPCVVVAHEIFYETASTAVSSPLKARYFALRDAAVLHAASRIAVPNRERRERICARLRNVADRIDLVPIAANVEPSGAYVRNLAEPGAFNIAAFGVVMPRRRFDVAIRALAQLRGRIDARLTIVGRIFDLVYADSCMQLAAELGVSEFVRFTGSLPAAGISAEMSTMHAAVHTAAEGSTRSSGSLLALLAHGIPVVAARTAFDDPCFDDVIIHAEPQPHALAEELFALAADNEHAARLGERAACKYRTDFDWRVLAQSLAS